jgi:phage I-like protein
MMGDEYPGSMGEWTIQDTVVKQVMADVGVDRAERIIEQDHITLIVCSPGDADSLSLAT